MTGSATPPLLSLLAGRASWLTLLVALLVFGLTVDGNAFAQGNSGKNKDTDSGVIDDSGAGETGPVEPSLHAVRYHPCMLATFSDVGCHANDMNNFGDIVGWSRYVGKIVRKKLPTLTGKNVACLYLPGAYPGEEIVALYDLLEPADQTFWIRLSNARTINDDGQIYGDGLRWIDDKKDSWTGASFKLTLGWTDDNGIHPTVIEEVPILGSVNAVNHKGGVTGENRGQAFILPVDSTEPVPLAGLENTSSIPRSINVWGDIVESATTSRSNNEAFVWTDGSLKLLGFLGNRGGGPFSFAKDVNDGIGDADPVVVGETTAGGKRTHAFRRQNGTMESLGTLGGDQSDARSINNLNQIVGWAEDASGLRHLYLYSDNKMTKLQDLMEDRFPETFTAAEAIKINDAGMILGYGRFTGAQTIYSFVLTPVPVEQP